VELTFDEESIRRAVWRLVEQGTAQEVGHALGDSLGRALLERIEQHEIVVRHAAAPPDRDQLAALAMQGLTARCSDRDPDAPWLAAEAYAIADAMLSARSRPPAPPPAEPAEPPEPKPIDWSAWKDGDDGYLVLSIDDNRYEVRKTAGAATFELWWCEPQVEELVVEGLATELGAQAAARDDYYRIPAAPAKKVTRAPKAPGATP